jgi:four helix bundle protein
MKGYKELEAWKKSMELVTDIYTLTRKFPKEELFGLTSQIRRAAISIPANIAEGIGRNHKKKTIQFLHIARGSIYEVDTLLTIATNVKIILEEEFVQISLKIEECRKILNGLITYYENSNLK